jgi:hypothetical protein
MLLAFTESVDLKGVLRPGNVVASFGPSATVAVSVAARRLWNKNCLSTIKPEDQ